MCIVGLSFGVVLAKNNVNFGDTVGSPVEGPDLLLIHADENFQ